MFRRRKTGSKKSTPQQDRGGSGRKKVRPILLFTPSHTHTKYTRTRTSRAPLVLQLFLKEQLKFSFVLAQKRARLPANDLLVLEQLALILQYRLVMANSLF